MYLATHLKWGSIYKGVCKVKLGYAKISGSNYIRLDHGRLGMVW